MTFCSCFKKVRRDGGTFRGPAANECHGQAGHTPDLCRRHHSGKRRKGGEGEHVRAVRSRDGAVPAVDAGTALPEPFRARQRGLLWGPLTQLDPCVGMMKGGPGMSGFVPGPCFHQLGRLSGCRQAGRMVSVSASQSMTLFCRSDSTPILMATIVEVPRSTLHACSSPRRMASRKLPM